MSDEKFPESEEFEIEMNDEEYKTFLFLCKYYGVKAENDSDRVTELIDAMYSKHETDEKPVIVEKLEPIPDFENMSLFELLKFYSDNEDGDWENWFHAVEEAYPFDIIFERFKAIENQLFELQAQFARLVNALDKQLDPVNVSLEEWIKR